MFSEKSSYYYGMWMSVHVSLAVCFRFVIDMLYSDQRRTDVSAGDRYQVFESKPVFSCITDDDWLCADGAPFTWWVGRSGDAHTYWAGAAPGTQQCGCAVHDDCVNPEHFCNCDRDLDDWY